MVRDTNMEKLQDIAMRLRIESIQATEASKSGYGSEWKKFAENFALKIFSCLLRRNQNVSSSVVFFTFILKPQMIDSHYRHVGGFFLDYVSTVSS